MSRLAATEVVDPSAVVAEPVESDGVGVAIAVRIPHRGRLTVKYNLPRFDNRARLLARVGSRAQNVGATALGVIAREARSLRGQE